MKALSLGYHDVMDSARAQDGSPRRITLYTIDRDDFCKHLDSIQHQPRQVPVRTITDFRFWQREVPVFLTFDDGAVSDYSCVAGELERNNWRGHFFITTDWIGRPGFLDRRQIRELHRRGHVIGSHSCSHPPRMSHLSGQELDREWAHSCAILSDILGEQVRVASVPDGYYSRRVGRAAVNAGIRVLFTSEPTAATSVMDGCLILGRYWIQRYTSPAVSGAVASGCTWPRWKQSITWNAKKAVKAVTGESYLTVRRYLVSKVLPQSSIVNGPVHCATYPQPKSKQ
jgi:peptidoglycan/xylan/chitin deacetylase (PgdA/CDA1 family)